MKQLRILLFFILITCTIEARNSEINVMSPGTIWDNGYGIGMEIDFEQAVGRTRVVLNHRLDYWLNDRLWFTFYFPLVVFASKKIISNLSINLTDDANASGLGDVELLGNYVLYRQDCEDVRKQLILTAGVTFPSSRVCTATNVDNAAYGFSLAAYGDYNSSDHIAYARLLADLYLKRDCFKRGDEIYFGGAFGWKLDIPRPPEAQPQAGGPEAGGQKPGGAAPDNAKLLRSGLSPFGAYVIKFDYIHKESDNCPNLISPINSNVQALSKNCPFECRCGADYFFMGPGIIVAMPNVLVQIALQVPVWQKLRIEPNTFVEIPGQPVPPIIPQFLQCNWKYNYRIILSVEGHF